MGGKRRWLVATAVVGAVAAAAWMLWAWTVPGLARDEIIAAFRRRGLSGVHVGEVRVGVGGSTITNLTIDGPYGLEASRVTIRYSPLGLVSGRVKSVGVKGVRTTVGFDSGMVRWRPLVLAGAGGRGESADALPFGRITVGDMHLRLDIGGDTICAVVRGRLRQSRDGELTVQAQADFGRWQAMMSGSFVLPTWYGKFRGRAERVPVGILESFKRAGSFQWPIGIRGGGSADVLVDVVRDGTEMSAQVRLDGEGIVLAVPVGDSVAAVGVDSLVAAVNQREESAATAWGAVAGGTYVLEARFDAGTFHGRYRVEARGVGVGELVSAIVGRGSASVGRVRGTAGVRADVRYREGVIGVAATVAGGTGGIAVDGRGAFGGASVRRLEGELRLNDDGGGWRIDTVWVGAEELRVNTGGTVVRADSVTVAQRVMERISRGSFRASGVNIGGRGMTPLRGSLVVDTEAVSFRGEARAAAGVPVYLSGTVGRGSQTAWGVMRLRVPEVEVGEDAPVGEWVGLTAKDVLSGRMAAVARVEWSGADVRQRLNLTVRNGVWRRPESDAGVLGVIGGIVLDRIVSPRTASPARLLFDSAYVGVVGFGDGSAVLSLGEAAPVVVRQLECRWAGGVLRVFGVVVQPDRKTMSMVLRFDGQQLQKVLDVFGYRGATAEGRIGGEVPLTVEWGRRMVVSIGEGTVRAEPGGGRIRFSRRTAQTILGIEEGQAGAEDDLERQVKVMMRRALEDMVFTELRVSFREVAGEGTLAEVHLEGYGPEGEVEQRIPVGSLDVRIHDIGRIIESVVRGGGGGRIE